jgi:hypothetical protein
VWNSWYARSIRGLISLVSIIPWQVAANFADPSIIDNAGAFTVSPVPRSIERNRRALLSEYRFFLGVGHPCAPKSFHSWQEP